MAVERKTADVRPLIVAWNDYYNNPFFPNGKIRLKLPFQFMFVTYCCLEGARLRRAKFGTIFGAE